jgi:hypothetical protein
MEGWWVNLTTRTNFIDEGFYVIIEESLLRDTRIESCRRNKTYSVMLFGANLV